MKHIRIAIVLLTCSALCLPASACCLFPWMPTYSGYGGYGCNYRPMGYGYAGWGYRNCGYVAAPCAVSCNPCCESSCCGSSCGSSCIPGGVRKEPVPDDISREKRSRDNDDGDRTFRGRDFGDDSDFGTDPTFGSESGRGDAGDDFGRGSGSDFGGGEAERWTPGGGTDGSGTGSGTLLDDIPDGSDFGGSSSRKPPTDVPEATDDSDGSAADDFESTEHGTRKPPVSDPIHESEAGDSSSGEDSTEFLSPSRRAGRTTADRRFLTHRELRSSHFGVVSARRLALDRKPVASEAKALSSGVKKDPSPRWISVPMPAGRVRL